MLESTPGSPVLFVGALLAVTGVGLLLVPDVPLMARQFRFGRLQAAQRGLEQGGLTPGDPGFRELVRLYDRSIEPEAVDPHDIERIRVDRRVIEEGEEATAATEYRFLVEYADHVGAPLSSYVVPPDPLYPEFRRAIDRTRRRFRLAGVASLVFGLVLQAGALYAS